MLNYKEITYQKFIKQCLGRDVIQSNLTPAVIIFQEANNATMQTKLVSLSLKITLADLKIKAQQAVELAKKGKVRVQLIVDTERVPEAVTMLNNVLYRLSLLKELNQLRELVQGKLIAREQEPEVQPYEARPAFGAKKIKGPSQENVFYEFKDIRFSKSG